MRTRATHLAATATLVLIAACGSGGSGDPPEPAACSPDGPSIRVHADDFRFDTDCVAVPAGEELRVELRNDDWEVHNFTVLVEGHPALLSQDTPFTVSASSGEVATTTWPAMEAGTYEFVCTLHNGMNGTFVVA